MELGIDLNSVIRDLHTQFIYTYNKYVATTEEELLEETLTRFNFLEIEGVKFKNQLELNNFLYVHAPLEIFGHADLAFTDGVAKLNEFIEDIIDDNFFNIKLVSVEHGRSIPATNFFISKTGLTFRDIKYSKTETDIWDGVDILITANPRLIENPPKGKTIIKINTDFNSHLNVNYQYESIIDFIDKNNNIDNIKLLN